MTDYIITKIERYSVTADDKRTALDHFHYYVNDLPLEALTISELTIDQDEFEYLDGTDTIEESND